MTSYILDPRTAFLNVLLQAKIPNLSGQDHNELITRFAFVVVRDTLVEMGIRLATAEKMACRHKGCARVRFYKCIKDMNISLNVRPRSPVCPRS